MGPNPNVCRFPGCDLCLAVNTKVHCIDCLEAPEENIHGALIDISYCSHKHLLLDDDAHRGECLERQNRRTMIRVAQLCSRMYHDILSWLYASRFDITGSYQFNPERIVHVRKRSNPRAGGQWYPSNMDIRTVLAAVGHDMCAFSVNLVVPLVAWLLRNQRIGLAVWHVRPIMTSQTIINYVDSHFKCNAGWHVIFTMDSASDRIVVDLTGPQYGHTDTISRSESYVTDHVSSPETAERHRFGHIIEFHHRNLTNSFTTSELKKHELLLEIAIRILCNTFHYNLMRQCPGGAEELFTMRHDNFMRTLHEIFFWLCEELNVQQIDLDAALFSDDWEAAYWELLFKNYGPGYHEMRAAYAIGRDQERF
ncbi:hypothetical protein DDE82_008510 [Stemphylium lycopersici]|nr:hypothetical protein TW65_00659 [Stemphylium lycopersici]RAQ99185.1 hypothetical protein DDE82_008510 [Stemphylium lycopersici]